MFRVKSFAKNGNLHQTYKASTYRLFPKCIESDCFFSLRSTTNQYRGNLIRRQCTTTTPTSHDNAYNTYNREYNHYFCCAVTKPLHGYINGHDHRHLYSNCYRFGGGIIDFSTCVLPKKVITILYSKTFQKNLSKASRPSFVL